MKAKLDPQYRLRGALWDRYYAPGQACVDAPAAQAEQAADAVDAGKGLFASVYDDSREADRFYAFLQNIFNLVPEDRFHTLIKEAVATRGDDAAIYRAIQAGLPAITPGLAMLTHAVPSLITQKREMGRQTAQLLGAAKLRDYVEIGTTGRYVNAVKKYAGVKGRVTLVHEVEPGFSPVDIVERGQIGKVGGFVKLNDYAPIDLPARSADLVSCFVGLHHMAPARLTPFLESIAAIVRPGGYFVVRDHDVTDAALDRFVALAHTVFNAGLGESWATNAAELRHFASVAEWINVSRHVVSGIRARS
jgi:SAM-dependent methyltransferase